MRQRKNEMNNRVSDPRLDLFTAIKPPGARE
jgi:hypothetical protein